MENLLRLQTLDLKIEACRLRETDIPKQKLAFDTQIARLDEELAASEERVKKLQLVQRECEGDIEQFQTQIGKYNDQLLGVKKNEEYSALLHEIENVKKHIAQREERIISAMVEIDEAKERLAADKKRISEERAGIESELKAIDDELAEAVKHREALEAKRAPFVEVCDPIMLKQYERIRSAKRTGAAVVPLVNEASCGGCQLSLLPQSVNTVLGGNHVNCRNCGRIVYHETNYNLEEIEASVS